MKILWVKSDFLHPTTRGGQIRTLEMLRCLHTRHEIHYVAFDDPDSPEGVTRSTEYCFRAYPVRHRVPGRRSFLFVAQLIRGLFSREPVAIRRYRSNVMRRVVEELRGREAFDRIVCDFLTPAVNLGDMRTVFLFQHNVESMIWERHAQAASNRLAKLYLVGQAGKMRAFERRICLSAGHVIAVSPEDRDVMRQMFGVSCISHVPTGVDVKRFTPAGPAAAVADLVFVGSMDWLPNIDGIRFFVTEVLPLIRRSRPNCSLAIVGRKPGQEIVDLAARDGNIQVTGTVGDVRPYLWGSKVSIVPIRIAGGTRLKIYEAMAARVPVISTTIGAEGLEVSAPGDIRIADTPVEFASQCIGLLENEHDRSSLAAAGWDLVSTRFSWEKVAGHFERILASPIG